MGCIISILLAALRIVLLVLKTAWRIIRSIIKILLKLGLALPMLAGFVFLGFLIAGKIIPGTPVFTAYWVGLIILTVLNIIVNIAIALRKSKKNSEKKDKQK